MTVLGEGKAPGIGNLRALGEKHALRNAGNIIDQVRSAVSRWQGCADEAGVTSKSAKMIAATIAPPPIKKAAVPKAGAKKPAANKPASAKKSDARKSRRSSK